MKNKRFYIVMSIIILLSLTTTVLLNYWFGFNISIWGQVVTYFSSLLSFALFLTILSNKLD